MSRRSQVEDYLLDPTFGGRRRVCLLGRKGKGTPILKNI
jgi:hypothetical protein